MIAGRSELYEALDVRATVWNAPAGDSRAGGDWSNVISIVGDVMAVTIGDVAGHGESVAHAAKIMLACIRGALWGGARPSDALRSANELACAMNGGTVVTAVIAVVDRRARTLTLANAGHPPPLMLTADTHAFLHQAPGNIPLGIFRHEATQDHVVELASSSLLVFYTDGITEHRCDPIAGEAALIRAARLAYDRPPANDAHAVARHVLAGGRSHDDAAAIALRVI